MDNRDKKKRAPRKRKLSLPHILGGEILVEDFVIKQSKLILLIVFLIIVFISNRYSCAKKLTRIEDLNRKLTDVKYENLVISTELTLHSRQSQIELLLERKGIELSSPKVPPFEIRK